MARLGESLVWGDVKGKNKSDSMIILLLILLFTYYIMPGMNKP